MAEKYTKWADNKSGVNPFVPNDPPKIRTILQFFLTILPRSLIAIPRWFLACIVMLTFISTKVVINGYFLIVTSSILIGYSYANETVGYEIVLGSILGLIGLVEISPIRIFSPFHLFAKIITSICGKLILLFLGVNYNIQFANSARVVGIKLNVPKSEPLQNCSKGDIIISNITNVLDVLFYYFHMKATPIYLFAYKEPISQKSLCVPASILKALCIASSPKGIGLGLGLGHPPKGGISISAAVEYCVQRGSPGILFVEGVRTNGTGVLPFPSELFESIPDYVKFHMSGFIYGADDKNLVSPVAPVGSAWSKLFYLASSLQSPYDVVVNYLPSEYLLHVAMSTTTAASTACAHPATSIGTLTGSKLEAMVQNWRETFCRLVSKKAVNLSPGDFQSFYEYYTLQHEGKVEEARAVADKRAKLS